MGALCKERAGSSQLSRCWLPELELEAVRIDQPGEFAEDVVVLATDGLDAFGLCTGEDAVEVVDHEVE